MANTTSLYAKMDKLFWQPWSKEREQEQHRLHARMDTERRQHHERFARFVTERRPRLSCQECGGSGVIEDRSAYGELEQRYSCGYCEGTGYVTPHLRSEWLRYKREEARYRKAKVSAPTETPVCGETPGVSATD